MADRLSSKRPGGAPSHSREQDFYDVLQVSRTASNDVIQAAYRALARASHPDLNGGMDTGSMRLLNSAYETLSDPVRRTAYDARMRGLRSQELRQLQTRQRARVQPVHSVSDIGPPRRGSSRSPGHAFRGTPSRMALLATICCILVVVLSTVVGVWAVASALDDSAMASPFEQFLEMGDSHPAPAQPFLNPR